MRRALAADIGVVMPGVRLRDDLTRDPRTYAIRVRDRLAGEGHLDLERMLAVGDDAILARFAGTIEREPVYGLPAAWIAADEREPATQAGVLVFDAVSVLGSHLAEAVRANAADLLGRQEFQTLLEHLRSSVPALVKEIGSEALPFGSVHRAFGLLLREGVWPRDPVHVLETMLEAQSRNPRELAESARRAIVPAMLRRRGSVCLEPAMFSPEFERRLIAAWIDRDGEPIAAPAAMALRERIERYAQRTAGDRAAILCTAALRPFLADFLVRAGVRVGVFAYGELPSDLEIRPAEVIDAGCVGV